MLCDHGDRMTTMVNGINGPRRNTPFDGWLRYAAGFSESSLEACIEAVRPTDASVVKAADPFLGVATAGRRAAEEGWAFRGIEAHPMIARVAALKFAPTPPAADLVTAARAISQAFEPGPVDGEHVLVRRMFADDILAEFVGLRNAITEAGGKWQAHLELALISILRDHAHAKVGWPYQLPGKGRSPRSKDPRGRFVRLVERFARDIAEAPPADVSVVHGDSREPAAWARADAANLDAILTSPPYLNNFDYADATRLELYFLGEVASWRELCSTVRSGMIIASTQQSHKLDAEAAIRDLAGTGIGDAIAPLIDELDQLRKRPGRRWGKAYNWLLALYFRDLRAVVANMAVALRPGGRAALVVGDSAPYGIYVDTPQLLTLVAEEFGFELVSSDVLRSRGARWRTNGSRHQVPLNERLVVWRRP